MKRLQISLEPELDQVLAAAAAKGGRSKAAVVRELIRTQLAADDVADDPFMKVVGIAKGGGPDDAEKHDDILYGPLR